MLKPYETMLDVMSSSVAETLPLPGGEAVQRRITNQTDDQHSAYAP
jgi:hypothetical protein